MRSISGSFVIFLCALNAAFVTSTGAGEEELSNDIADDVSAVQETPDASTRAKEITAELENSDTDTLSLETRFDKGVEAYLDNEWEDCIENFEKAIAGYKEYRKFIVGCRRKCRVEANAAEPIFAGDIEDYHFYEKKVRETLCLMKCKKLVTTNDIKAKQGMPEYIEVKYLERRPYEYLHICYYQMKRNQDAANAVFTFLAFHRSHEQSLKNLHFYADLPDVDENELVDLEAEPYSAMYKAGIAAFSDGNHHEVVEQLENSIKAYIEAENNCRMYCEGPFDQGWLPEFTMSVANQFVYGLRCKRGCAYRMSMVDGEERANLLLDHYHYLQISYSKIGRLREACAAVESYLYFVSNEETVLKNKEYFMGLPDVKKEYFAPRQEALLYLERQEYELRLLLFIQDEFKTFANSTSN